MITPNRGFLFTILSLMILAGIGLPCMADAQASLESVEWVAEGQAEAGGPSAEVEVIDLAKRAGVEKVIGSDDRENVGNTTAYPWRTIGRITGRFSNGDGTETSMRGTGVLIGRKTVLTCGHVIVDQQQWAQGMTFAPGKDGSYEPYGRISVVKKRVPKIYFDQEDADYDLGLLVLETAIGNETGYMKMDAKSTSFFDNAGLSIAGYPGDLGETTELYYAFGHSAGLQGNLILHKVDTASGQSGSPVWVYYQEDDLRQLVGVHVRGSTQRNYAVRITDSYFNWINDYLKENDTVYYDTSGSSSTGSTSSRPGDQNESFLGACAGPALGAFILLGFLGFCLIRPGSPVRR
ncbi:MAG: trypsin-like peptidase domain-containing protein [Phycisphaerae bacterium]|nr:trypsin-like peptidase domain-containing protein [Phycisphaerae bacterium]